MFGVLLLHPMCRTNAVFDMRVGEQLQYFPVEYFCAQPNTCGWIFFWLNTRNSAPSGALLCEWITAHGFVLEHLSSWIHANGSFVGDLNRKIGLHTIFPVNHSCSLFGSTQNDDYSPWIVTNALFVLVRGMQRSMIAISGIIKAVNRRCRPPWY